MISLCTGLFENFIEETTDFVSRFVAEDRQAGVLLELGKNLGILAGKQTRNPGEDREILFAAFRESVETASGLLAKKALCEEKDGFCRCTFDLAAEENWALKQYLLAGFAGAVGAQVYGSLYWLKDRSLLSENRISLDFSYEKEGEEDALEINSDGLLAKEKVTVCDIFIGKIDDLKLKIRDLEADTNRFREKTAERNRPDFKLFQLNQELEKNNIELKMQNSMLSEKNAELAFQLMDVEEETGEMKRRISQLERLTIEEDEMVDLLEEKLRKEIQELNGRLARQERDLDTALAEIQNKTTELDGIRKEHYDCTLMKEAMEKDVVLLKKQLRYKEDSLADAVREKEFLQKQIDELESLNEQLSTEYIKRVECSVSRQFPDIAEVPQDGGYYGKIASVVESFLGKQMLADKAFAKAGFLREDSLDSAGLKKVLNYIDKAAEKIAASPQQHLAMMDRLKKLN